MARLLRTLGVVVVLVVGLAGPASACSCAAGTTAEHAARAGLIVRASVVGIDRSLVGNSSADPVVYVLRVSQSWKGPADAQVRVRSAASGASCGLEGFEVGDDLVVFAEPVGTGQPGTQVGVPWMANLCGGTSPATPALVGEVQAALGAGTPVSGGSAVTPAAGPSGSSVATDTGAPMSPVATAHDTQGPLPFAGLGGIIAVAVVLGLLLWFAGRRRRG